MLFSGTVYDNFKLLATSDETLMKEALEFAALDKEISLNSKLSEAGGGISIGQLQRLMIAIAYATKRSIFLLDEFSSALDDNNAQIIKKQFNQS
ncbi:MAG: ATP-binding cassette domain-containing protein [Clostridium sp.]|nr:MAG: ATP-binding cassette domain-containing protein [Clostridium sp.]